MLLILETSSWSDCAQQFVGVPSLLIALAVVALAAIWALQRSHDPSLPPVHPWGLPYFGDGLDVGCTVPVKFFWSRYKKYGPVFRLKVPGLELFVVTDPKVVMYLLKDSATVDLVFPPSIKTLTGDIPHMNDRAEHALWRKGMTKALGPAALPHMLPEIERILDRHLDEWAANPRFSLMDKVMKVAIDIGVDVVGGLKLPDDVDGAWAKDRVREFIDGLIALPLKFPGTTYHRALVAKKQLWEKLKTTCEKELKNFLQKDPNNFYTSDDESMNMVDAQLAAGFGRRPITAEMLFERILGNYIAAIETTRSAFWLVLTMVGQSPRVQKALREEQDKVVSELGPAFTPASLQAMPYLEATVKEVLRITPATVGGARTLPEPLQLGKYTIPPGSILLWSKTLMHALDPALWDGSHSHTVPPHMDWMTNLEGAFIPERWLPGSEHPKPKSYLSFGSGSHMCVGMVLAYAEVKMVLAAVLRRFDYRFLNPNVMHQCRYFPTPKPGHGTDVVEVLPRAPDTQGNGQ